VLAFSIFEWRHPARRYGHSTSLRSHVLGCLVHTECLAAFGLSGTALLWLRNLNRGLQSNFDVISRYVVRERASRDPVEFVSDKNDVFLARTEWFLFLKIKAANSSC
jgi:hypothetical protein